MTELLLTAGVGVIALNVYALLLVILRGPLFRTRVYRPMLLNIGLSVAPAVVLLIVVVVLLIVVEAFPSPIAMWSVMGVGAIIWLLLLPNSAYLITELNFSHRRDEDDVPLWFDIVLVLTLAMSGVINTLANVALVQLLAVLVAAPNAAYPLHHPVSWGAAALALVLVALGMYLGRYVRFNSWDLLRPARFLRKLVDHFREPRNSAAAAGFVITHSVFLTILYVIIAAPTLLAIVP
ncbi:DUF1361 domain-containing protein [Microbacterium stercoris]|uniref:DUF1361 domain-containing protein n=1 Tax=Microbacterium stercoris TaxID=2820289 RepID=A0A939QKY5_9MICO|nr:DUF1361 domain-containing protein [Microbacterium stercoris]MBO3664848.1 DUF1361 domain-containing protein [Microbacterium stercoris]